MKLLDLFCCAGGAAMGYHRAGFTEIVGVDIDPQPHYPFTFVQGDALAYLAKHGRDFDAVHASPPCQAWTLAQRIQKREHPELIVPLRPLLHKLGLPYVIENVEGAPLKAPVLLCGGMFGLRTYRHRLFECSFPLQAPPHPAHVAPLAKMGRKVRAHEFMHVVGNFTGAALAREIMQMPWATRNELREAIPPAYTEYVGQRLLKAVKERQ